jgi:hypothetical protein
VAGMVSKITAAVSAHGGYRESRSPKGTWLKPGESGSKGLR